MSELLYESFVLEVCIGYLAPRICLGCLVGSWLRSAQEEGEEDDDGDNDANDGVAKGCGGRKSSRRTPLTVIISQ